VIPEVSAPNYAAIRKEFVECVKIGRINFRFQIKNSFFIQVVDPDLTRSMNDPITLKQDSDMVNFAFRILKEYKVSWSTLFDIPE
jgi:hypothetical protein